MVTVPVSNIGFEELCIVAVRAGTNCPAGGDSGYGGRTVFGITNEGATDLRAGINGGEPVAVNSVEIVLGGDNECEVFIKGLEHALEVLKAQVMVNRSVSGSATFE